MERFSQFTFIKSGLITGGEDFKVQAAMLAQLEEPPEQPPEPEPELKPEPEPEKPPIVDSAALALLITQSCNTAGISNLIEPLINSTKLADEATVNAAITNAKAVRDRELYKLGPRRSIQQLRAWDDYVARACRP